MKFDPQAQGDEVQIKPLHQITWYIISLLEPHFFIIYYKNIITKDIFSIVSILNLYF